MECVVYLFVFNSLGDLHHHLKMNNVFMFVPNISSPINKFIKTVTVKVNK